MTRWTLVLALGVAGCTAPYGHGAFDADGAYVAGDLPLRIAAAPLGELNERWLVDSHMLDGRARRGREFLHIRSTDWNDDGVAARYWSYVYHLRLGQRTGSGELWLQSKILEPDEQSRDLRHLADGFLSSMAEGRTENVMTWNGQGTPVQMQAVRQQMEITVLDRMDGQLGGQQAHLVTFRASRNDGAAQFAMLFARAPFYHAQRGGPGKVRGWPVLLVAGYANGPGDFAGGLPDFDRFLRAIEMEPNAGDFGPRAD